jgi:LacI family transcriptional regulator
MATLLDISRRVSLSPASVSKILSGQPGFNEDTRQRVQAVAKELNYRPNLTARGLRDNKSYLIGLLDDKVNAELLAGLLDGVQSAASARRHAPIVFVHKDGIVQDQNVALCLDRHIDGLLVTVHVERDESIHVGALADLVARDFPIIELHGTCLPQVPSVRFDYEAGGRMAARHLLELGHRRIAIFPHEQRGVATPSNLFWYRQEFMNGCQAECKAAGAEFIAPRPVDIPQQSDFVWKSVAQQAVGQILTNKRPPTAIVCMGTVEAVSILHVLENANIKVPQQMSLIAHCPYGIESFLAHTVTEVRHSSQEAGALAVNNLFERMEGHTVSNALIGPELVVGETTAPPPPTKTRE